MKLLFISLALLLLTFGSKAQVQLEPIEEPTETNTSNAIGTLPGSLGVSPSGAATYTIPLAMPPGRMGMVPNVSFYYNSQQGYASIMGKGWNITGFSAITRANQTLYYNGENDNVDFENDELLLDGQHLIPNNTPGSNEFRLETNPSLKVLKENNSNGIYFVVYFPNGEIWEYGNTENSKQTYLNNPPLAWHISKKTDRYGNSIKYNYIKFVNIGTLQPSEIYYTGDGSKSLGGTKIAFNYLVDEIPTALQQTSYFEYQNQPYINKTNLLLDNITVSDDEDNSIYKYQIDYYSDAGFCKEKYVQNINFLTYVNNETFTINPTHFDYNHYTASQIIAKELNAFDQINPLFEFNKVALDIQGDKKSEIATAFTVGLSAPPYKKHIIKIENMEIVTDGVIFKQQLHSIDWDGNGDDELIFVDDYGIKIYNYNASTSNMVMVWQCALNEAAKIFSGDFTGDGRADILLINNNSCELLIATINQQNEISYTLSPFTLNNINGVAINMEEIVFTGDFNGDGVHEILFNKLNQLNFETFAYNSTTGFTHLTGLFISSTYNETKQGCYYSDFNADGRIDICYLVVTDENVKKKMYFSIGDKFIASDCVITELEDLPTLVLDYNNDGRADFITLAESNEIMFTCPNGTSTVKNILNIAPLNEMFDNLELLPMNYDGNENIDFTYMLFTDYYEPNYPEPQNSTLKFVYLADTISGNDALSLITNGHGASSAIIYGTSKAIQSCNVQFPFQRSGVLSSVVSETYLLAPETKWNRNSYTFTNPVVHAQGRGFLGFLQSSTTNYSSNTLATTIYDVFSLNNLYHQLIPVKNTVHSLNKGIIDKLLSQTLLTHSAKPFETQYPLCYIPVTTQSVTQSWDNDDNHSYKGITVAVQNINDLDAFGNSTLYTSYTDETATQSDPTALSGMKWKQCVSTVYNPASVSPWLNGQPQQVNTTLYHTPELPDAKPTEASLTKYYYNQANPYELEHTRTIPNSDETLATETWYEYDAFGNCKTEILKTTINNQPTEKKITYEYSSSMPKYRGRFLTRKTIHGDVAGKEFVSTYTYDTKLGYLLTETDINNNTTSYTYNHLGQVATVMLPANLLNQTTTGWVSEFVDKYPQLASLVPADALIYSLSYQSVRNAAGVDYWNKKLLFTNKYGQTLRGVTEALDGQYIVTDMQYDKLGRPYMVSEPYYSTASPTQWTTTQYDALGRAIAQQLPTGVVHTTSYNGLTLRTANQTTGTWQQQTLNAMGKTTSITDPAGTLTYKYDAATRAIQIDAQGAITTITYDKAGRQSQIDEPNAGLTAYTYNNLGQLCTQTDAKGNIQTLTYDHYGRTKTRLLMPDNETSLYTYYEIPGENGYGQLKDITKTTADGSIIKTAYTYDMYGRATEKIEHIDGNSYTFAYGYNEGSGVLEKYTYPTGYFVTYHYNPRGYMEKVKDNTSKVLWQALTDNTRGQLTSIALGNGLYTHNTYNAYGLPETIRTTNVGKSSPTTWDATGNPKALANDVQYNYYRWDNTNGNLTRKWEYGNNNNWKSEIYDYDTQLKERLTHWQISGSTTYNAQYTPNGNIATKTDITQPTGQYTYANNAGPHAVTGINAATQNYFTNSSLQNIQYNGINKISGLSQGDVGYNYEITYGTTDQRVKSYTYTYVETGLPLQTKYYFDNYEVKINHTNKETSRLHYISASTGIIAIVEQKNNNPNLTHYIHTDYQGSYQVVSNEQGNKLEYLAYDPWGRRRNPNDWSFTNVPTTLFDRGYTGHEHLDKFDLINMNGRVYDPALGRFLSPDPFVTNAANLQSYNRYSYCLNNPLKYTDPTGYFNENEMAHHGKWTPIYTLGTEGGGSSNPWGYQKITPGSGNHWSDQTNSVYANFMLMSSSSFQNYYGVSQSDFNSKIAPNFKYLPKDSHTFQTRNGQTGFWARVGAGNYGTTNKRLYTRNGNGGIANKLSGAELVDAFVVFGGDDSQSESNPIIKVLEDFNEVSNWTGISADGVLAFLGTTIAGRNLGYAISNINFVVKSTNSIPVISVVANGVGTVTDVILSISGDKPWLETGLNFGVTFTSVQIGGIPGVCLSVGYNAGKGYINLINNNPQYAPNQSQSFIIRMK